MAIRSSRRKPRAKKERSFSKQRKAARSASAIRARERQRIEKRFSSLLQPAHLRKVKRRRRGATRFTRTLKAGQTASRILDKTDRVTRTTKRVYTRLSQFARLVAPFIPFTLGAKDVVNAAVHSR